MKPIYYQITIVVLVVTLLLSVQKCKRVRDISVVNMASITDTVKYFNNRLGVETASKKTLQVDKRQLQSVILDKDKDLAAMAAEFAKVRSVSKITTITKYDTINVAYTDSVPCVFERDGRVTDKWYSFGYKATQKGFTVDSLTIPNNLTIMTGVKRKWFLGKEMVTTDVTNSNPYVKVTGVTSAELVIPEPWFKKWYLWLAAGAIGGMILK